MMHLVSTFCRNRHTPEVLNGKFSKSSSKKGLVVGIANGNSIAYGSAERFRELGAELAITSLNTKAEPHVRLLAEELGSRSIVPCDVWELGQLEAVFENISRQWGRLDLLYK